MGGRAVFIWFPAEARNSVAYSVPEVVLTLGAARSTAALGSDGVLSVAAARIRSNCFLKSLILLPCTAPMLTLTTLPAPSRMNIVREMREIATILHRSIEFGLGRREEAVAYALGFARDMEAELADQFVGMYVNKWTLDFGNVGRGAVRTLLDRGLEAGLLPPCGDIDFIRP